MLLHSSGVTEPFAEAVVPSISHRYTDASPAEDEKMTTPVPGDTVTPSTVPTQL
jgi:hypothetical protein